ncbi:MAG: hypothetical protein R3195_17785 [Gemmatimonadota bacterium]|nr:hypothetical protein [Gemmatimonadota bacterium]
MSRVTVWLGLATIAAAACAPSGPRGVPVEQEPRHRLVSDRPEAQVLDIAILGSDTTLYHTHARPIAYICLRGSRMATQPAGGEWTPAGQACDPGSAFSNPEYGTAPLTHRVANDGTDVFHLIGVQHLGDGAAPAAPTPTPAGSALVENDWFHVVAHDVTPPPGRDPYGGQRQMHSHATLTLLVLVADGAVSSIDAAGSEQFIMERGAWTWLEPGIEHGFVAIDGLPTRVVEVEVR